MRRTDKGYNTTPDLRGRMFGRLLAVDIVLPKTRHIYWHCWCACGNSCKIQTTNLISGGTQSCGCLRRELTRDRGAAKRLSDNIKLKPHTRGMTIAQYNILCDKQKGKCAICGQFQKTIDSRSNKPRSLYLDHNHKTNENRGLLCSDCNSLLGFAKDDFKILQKAGKYLQEWTRGDIL